MAEPKTLHELIEAARPDFREWFIRMFTHIGMEGPNNHTADLVFNRIALRILEEKRANGDASATHGK